MDVIDDFGSAWEKKSQGVRFDAVMEGARRLRARLSQSTAVVSVRTLPRASLVYPSRYAFCGAAMSPARYISMVHRTHLVQFRAGGAVKNLLFNPTDTEAARATPYLANVVRRVGALEPILSKKYDSLEVQLAKLGLSFDDIDYIAFDHFHTQDVRPLLGTTDGRLRPRFPRAQLLAPECEWNDWERLHPMQAAWFVADGRKGVNPERVVLTHDDRWLGDGVALVRTPGHTSGNQTLFVKTDRGIWGISENGVAADNWAPKSSRVAGVRAVAKSQMLDVVLNSNTIESGADQYTSMMLEKTVVDPLPGHDGFVQMFPSSEAEASFLAPGLTPTVVHGRLESGSVQATGARKHKDVTAPSASATA